MADWMVENQHPEWFREIEDSALRSDLGRSVTPGDFTGMIRAAFVHLERRIRQSAGLADHFFGKDLIDQAFHPETGILQPVSPVGGERAGLHHFLVGLFLYYRNPVAHRPVPFTEQSCRQVLFLIDHALLLLSQAVQLSFTLEDYVGQHEGQILNRRDYRLDIDGDGNLEIVILLELGATWDDAELHPHLMPVILKKHGQEYRRIPAAGIRGWSLYGPEGVVARHVTNHEQPDLVVSWAWGETQTVTFILRLCEGQYVLARRQFAPDAREPYSGPPSEQAFFVHPRQDLDFADVDGDGIVEIVQTLSFDDEDLDAMGYSSVTKKPDERHLVCRLLKWDAEKERILQVDERLVAWKRPSYSDAS